MREWSVFVNRARLWLACAAALLPLIPWACHSAESPVPEEQRPAEPAAAASPVPPTPAAAARHEALPRSVVGVVLGMRFSEAQKQIGELKCHTNEGGFQVCDAVAEQIGEAHHLEIYVYHDRVISVAYEGPAPSSALDAVDKLIDRYGKPSLSGIRQRDTTGRLHEIYGWKDDESLYSIRFMWKDTEAQKPELLGTAVALWDRKGYQQWEAESKQQGPPKPTPDESGQPT
jgi:hypothetical protein